MRNEELCKQLRRMTSAEAANFLMSKAEAYQDKDRTFVRYVKCRSWKVCDQVRLVRFFLDKKPFASEKPYDYFLSVMSVKNFIKILNELDPELLDNDLFKYYIRQSLMKINISGSEADARKGFLEKIGYEA